MNKINKKVKNRFEFFEQLLKGFKTAEDCNIHLGQKNNNTRWLTGASVVTHQVIDEQIELIVEQSLKESKYGIKLRCKALITEPFFRFDSDGPAHRNEDSSIPLEHQSITTPHFNSYDKYGRPIAYKNQALQREGNAKEICKDINFGVSLFFDETNMKLQNGNYPQIIVYESEFNFGEKSIIDYDNINFE